MQDFFIILIIGLFLLALLLLVFFTVGKKNKKEKNAEQQLVLSCCDEGLIRLYEQAKSESERNDIVEFIKEKLAWAEKNNVPGEQGAAPLAPDKHEERRKVEGVLAVPPEETLMRPAEADIQPEKPQTQPAEAATQPDEPAAPLKEPAVQTQPAAETANSDYDIDLTHLRLPDEIEWRALDDNIPKKDEEYDSVMAQNLQMQEVLAKIKNIEESLLFEKKDTFEKYDNVEKNDDTI